MRLLLTFVACMLYTQLSAQSWMDKIDVDLWTDLSDQQLHPCLVVFEQQADVSRALLFQNKEDKAAYVYEQLVQTAESTQTNIRSILQTHQSNYRSYVIVNAIWTMADKNLITILAQQPEVAHIDSDPIISLPQARETNSSFRGITWGVSKVNADDVWALGHKGQNVIVGGQDTGVEWDHPAIINAYKGWDGTSADHNYHWHDAIHTATGNPCGVNTSVPCDDNRHGTHTVGTMVGDDGANEQIGVAPEAKWIACRNMDEGDGTPSTYIECFEWFLAPTDSNNQNPDVSQAPHVINNSWGCPLSEGCNPGNFATMELALNNLRAAGCVIVVSAGNSGSGCSSIDDPAAIFEGSFTVGALNSSDNAAGFSSRGPVTVDGSNRQKPNIAAPGVSVRSAVLNGQYQSLQGTSMAGPHVAGVVALLISAQPSLAGDVDMIEDILEQSAVPLTTAQTCTIAGSSIPNNTYGYGRVDALAAINAATILPVDLLTWEAKVGENQQVDLVWITTNTFDADRFEIERSSDLQHWTKINTTAAQNTALEYTYQAQDNKPRLGANYYRLKMIDLDGSYEYSKVVVATIVGYQKEEELLLYPNPVAEYLVVGKDDTMIKPSRLMIYSALGQVMRSIELVPTADQSIINVSNLPKGSYFIQAITMDGRVVKNGRFIKK